MKVIVLGAGLGGLAAARYLATAGHTVEVYEQASELRNAGAALILWPNGSGIMRDLGVPIDNLGSRIDDLDTMLQDGAVVLKMNLRKMAKSLGAPTIVAPRGILMDHLESGLHLSVIRFDKRAIDIVEPALSNEPVTVLFEDGTKATGDILIAADGHRSIVRRKLIGPKPARYTGFATWHGLTRVPIALSRENRMLAIYGQAGFSTLFSAGDGLLQWVFVTPFADGDRVPPGHMDPAFQRNSQDAPSPIGNLRDRFSRWTSPIPELLDHVTDADISVYPHIVHDVPDAWGRGRVILLGDAMHAVPPTLGQGVNQTLEDAWALREAFAAHPGAPDAILPTFQGYRAKRVQRLAWLAAKVENRPAPPRFLRRMPGLVPYRLMNQWTIMSCSSFLRAPDARKLRTGANPRAVTASAGPS